MKVLGQSYMQCLGWKRYEGSGKDGEEWRIVMCFRLYIFSIRQDCNTNSQEEMDLIVLG